MLTLQTQTTTTLVLNTAGPAAAESRPGARFAASLVDHIGRLVAKVQVRTLEACSQGLMRAAAEMIANPTLANFQRYAKATEALDLAITRTAASKNPRVKMANEHAAFVLEAVQRHTALQVVPLLEKQIQQMILAMPADPAQQELDRLKKLMQALAAALAIIARFSSGPADACDPCAAAGPAGGAAHATGHSTAALHA